MPPTPDIWADMRAACPKVALRVAPVYRLLNWKWANVGVPDAAEILRTLLYLVESLRAEHRDGVTRTSTGGLCVRIWRDEGGGLHWELGMFIGEWGLA